MSFTSLRSDWKSWLPAAVLLTVNLCAFALYQGLWAGRAEERSTAVERQRDRLAQVTSERETAERLATRAERNHRRLTRLYRQRFRTQEERVTKLIAEVKRLARRSGLDPATIRYPDQAIEGRGLVKRSIVFGVDGSYQALRRLINLLEVTDTFVILEEIRPGGRSGKGSSGNNLSIDLAISTLFLEDDLDPERLAADRDSASETS